MEKLPPFHHHHNAPFWHRTPLSHKPKPGTHSPTPLFPAPTTTATTSLETITPPISTSPGTIRLSKFQSSDVKTLDSVKTTHAHLIKMGKEWNPDSKSGTLVTSYLEHGDYRSAAVVFLLGFASNYAMWAHFMEEFESFGHDPSCEILAAFQELHCIGVTFDSRTIIMILNICSKVMNLWLGLAVHANLIKRGELDVYVKCGLMIFYWMCCDVGKAMEVFHDTVDRDDRLWNEAVVINLKSGKYNEGIELFRVMQFLSAKANARTVVKMLQACGVNGALNGGKQIHAYLLKHGLESNLSVCNTLISMYSRNGKLKLASRVFYLMKDHSLSSWNSLISSYTALGYFNDAWNLLCKMESSGVKPDIVTWNSLLSGHAFHGSNKEVLAILQRMQMVGSRPNSISITSVLQGVSGLGFLSFGKATHGYVIRHGLNYDVYVGTSLLDMYVKNECLTSARAVFDGMKNKNICAWNSLIAGYSVSGLFHDAKTLLKSMQEDGIKPDLVTWNGLVSGYSIRGCLKEARAVIDEIKSSGLTPNVVTWTALVSGFSQNGNYSESLDFFTQMQREGIKPASATILGLLRTCGSLSLLQKGKEIHCFSMRNGFVEDAYIATALVDMYSKTGDLKSARELFRNTENKTIASWNCMVMGFAIYGYGREAISLFSEMQRASIVPDAITFTAVLSGCKNSGLVEEGWKFFDSMSKEHNMEPTIEHYSCMVDLLGRAGFIDEAWDFIRSMPIEPDASVWGAFLGSCRIHGSIDLAEIAAKKLFRFEPYNSANYTLLTNLYAALNRWEDVDTIREIMAVKGLKNGKVWSWIQIDEKIHTFSAGGRPHKDEGEIYFELYQLVSDMKKLGYVPDVNCVYQDIDDVEKEKVLLGHTEKLAITYGLIKARSTGSSKAIRVIKNTRICSDCHTAAKFISIVRSCEIVLRDGVRFHHFKAGKCSCNDYW